MNVLVLYNAHQTFTNTVFEYLAALERHSRNTVRFCHVEPFSRPKIDFGPYDVVCVHYSLRLPFDELSAALADRIAAFDGVRALFIQDEYDHTRRTWHWMRRCRFTDVFSLVPRKAVPVVYPAAEVGDIAFHESLAGYAPDDLPSGTGLLPPSERPIVVGYRARELPVRYGQLGFDKVNIGRDVKAYCATHGIAHDISWREQDRIYGEAWLTFLSRCRATLGSESGCNVFDWDGELDRKVRALRKTRPALDDQAIYESIIRQHEMPGTMNQVSPRIFESIAMRSVLMLYEGAYSGVVEPGKHFLPLRHDLSNIGDLFRQLNEPSIVDAMAARAYDDVIGGGRYSLRAFVATVDDVFAAARARTGSALKTGAAPSRQEPGPLSFRAATTASPIRSRSVEPPRTLPMRLAYAVWGRVPVDMRVGLRPLVRRLLGRP